MTDKVAAKNKDVVKKIVLKLGGSILTKKDVDDFPLDVEEIKERSDDYIRYDIVRRIGNELKEAIAEKELQIILVNGVGPFGHFLVKYERPDGDARESVRYLNGKLVSEFREVGLDVVPIAPSKSCEFVNGKFDISYLWELAGLLIEEGKILSTYGDVLQNGRVISGDDLVVLLAKQWEASKIITATDVDGVFTKDPKLRKDAILIRTLGYENSEKVEYTVNRIDVTGGMASKVEKLREAAKHKIKCQIINGLKEGNIRAALLGDESIGTLVLS
jgi:isopentenyl phosphate kinase